MASTVILPWLHWFRSFREPDDRVLPASSTSRATPASLRALIALARRASPPLGGLQPHGSTYPITSLVWKISRRVPAGTAPRVRGVTAAGWFAEVTSADGLLDRMQADSSAVINNEPPELRNARLLPSTS